MIPAITSDFETKSYADLKKVGAWSYSEDLTTEVICYCYQIDDQPICTWRPGLFENDECPADLRDAIEGGATFEAHNISFEIAIWRNIMVKRYGWPDLKHSQLRDSMAVACYYALPAALEALARALGFPGKDPDGGRLITKYSKLYLKTAKAVIPPEDLDKFVAYCQWDVQLEKAISDWLGDLPPRELECFLFDLDVNLRGLLLDQDGIDAATAVVEQRSAELTAEFRELTGLNPTQGEKLHDWFRKQGVALENLQAEYLQEILDDYDLPSGPSRRAIEIRLRINKASTKKLDAMSRQRGSDGRARFQTRYHGAGTGRNTGAGFQPLNLSRGFEKLDPNQLVRDIGYRDPRWLDAIYGDAMDAVAKASRNFIMAAPGNKIMSGDFISIEAVILACLAGEEWKIEAFRNKAKIYELMADKIYNLPPGTVTKDTHPAERQDGKIGELAFGYQGALGAWLGFDTSGRHSDERIIQICKAWRSEHPETVSLWYGLEAAAIEATEFPGRITQYRQLGFEIVDEWLSMILPNGKRIWYFDPQLRATMPRWHQPLSKPECADGTCNCKAKPQLTYMAQKMGHWQRVSTYGGKLTENATQATSRELLKPVERAVASAGYHVILSVYDEIVAEVDKDFGSNDEFKNIMSSVKLDWAQGWPIGVDVWSGERYRK